MPDLITHTATSYLLGKSVKIKKYLLIFCWGNILPDILTRPLYIIFPQTGDYTIGFHTPFGIIPVLLLISLLFEEKEQKSIFLYLYIGSIFHMFLDSFQKHIGEGYYWLFPFSWKSFGFNLFWTEDSLYAIPFLILLTLIVIKPGKNIKYILIAGWLTFINIYYFNTAIKSAIYFFFSYLFD
jgi:hypothetical protein